MSRERALTLLSTAAYEDDPETTKKLIRGAMAQLRTAKDADPIEFLELTVDMISDHLRVLANNLPGFSDDPDTKAQKFTICESQLMTIKEYATQGLKARTMGSDMAATEMLSENHTLQEFKKAKAA